MKAIARYSAVAALLLAAAPFAAKADQISLAGSDIYCLSGSCSYNLSNGSSYTLSGGQIDVLSATVSPLSTSGVFNSFSSATVAFNLFNYNTPTTQKLFTLTEGTNTLVFDATSWTVTTAANNELDLGNGVGTYTVTINGVPTTYSGTFELTTQGDGVGGVATVSFSDTNSLSVTPEPNSLLLMGTGLVSAGGVLLRRRRSADVVA